MPGPQTAGDKRAPLGAVASRDLKSIDLGRTNVAVIRYDTVFAHKAAGGGNRHPGL